MNILIRLIVLAVIFTCFFPFSSYTYYDYTHKVEVEVTEVPYRPVYAFLKINFEAGNEQSGASIGIMSAKQRDIQLESHIGYRSLGNTGSFDVMLGGAYFPRRPSFALGDMPVRVKISALGGMGMSDDMFFTFMASAGLVLSSEDDPSGLTAEFVYWPSVKTTSMDIPGSLSFKLGFLFAPE